MKTIGIKLADGSFYPVLEEGSAQTKKLELTTANNNQTKVMVDLYRSATCSMEDAEYVDSLQIENLIEHPNGEAVIAFTVSLDEDNQLDAQIIDEETGNSSVAEKIQLISRTIEERLNTDEFGITEGEEPEFNETEVSEEDIEQAEEGEPAVEETADETEENNSNAGTVAAVALGGVAAGAGLMAMANAINKKREEENETIDEGLASFHPEDDAAASQEILADQDEAIFEDIETDDTDAEEVSAEEIMSSSNESAIEEDTVEDVFSEALPESDETFEMDDAISEEASIFEDDTIVEDKPLFEDDTIVESSPVFEDDTIVEESPVFEDSNESEDTDDIFADTSDMDFASDQPAADESSGFADMVGFDDSDTIFGDMTEDNGLNDMFAEDKTEDDLIQNETIVADNAFNADDTAASEDLFADMPSETSAIDDMFADSDSSAETLITDDLFADDVFADSSDNSSANENNSEDLFGDMNLDDMDFEDTTPAAGGISFTGLYDKETEMGTSSLDDDDDTKKNTKVPVIICLICAVICILAVILILFVIPSPCNVLKKNGTKEQVKEVVAEPSPAPVVEEIEPVVEEEPAVPEAKEDEIVIVEKAEEVVPVQPEPAVKKPENIEYKIKWGDTLWDIAGTYYKNPWKYKYIARYNGIKNPDYIISGTKIIIPAE